MIHTGTLRSGLKQGGQWLEKSSINGPARCETRNNFMLVSTFLPLSEISRELNSLAYLHVLLPTLCMQVYEPLDYLHLIGLDPLEAGKSDQYIVTGMYLPLLITYCSWNDGPCDDI